MIDPELWILVHDGDAVTAARQPNLPPEVAAYLAVHPSEGVRGALAANPGVPAAELDALMRDVPRVRQCAVCNPSLPLATIQQLASDEDSEARCDVTANPGTPTSILRKLAKDPDYFVRRAAQSALRERNP